MLPPDPAAFFEFFPFQAVLADIVGMHVNK